MRKAIIFDLSTKALEEYSLANNKEMILCLK